MAEILQIQRKKLFNQSINPLNIHICAHTASHAYRVNTWSSVYMHQKLIILKHRLPSYIDLVFCNDPMSCYICSAILFICINLSWTVFFTLNFLEVFYFFQGIFEFHTQDFLNQQNSVHSYIYYLYKIWFFFFGLYK